MARIARLNSITPAEQRVLDGIAAGITDAEIAVRAGISVAEVKSIVAGMVAKSGVASRNDLARLAAPRAKPRWLRRHWIAVGGGAAASAFVGLFFFAGWCSGGAGREIWVAESVALSPEDGRRRLVVQEALSGKRFELSPPDDAGFWSPQWSPDGTRLAAWEIGSGGTYVRLWERDGSERGRAEVSMPSMRFDWSRDSSLLFAASEQRAMLFTRDGAVVADVAIQEPDIGNRVLGRTTIWSPHSTRLVLSANGLLLVMETDGTVSRQDLTALDYATDPFLVSPHKWLAEDVLEFVYRDTDPGLRGFTITVGDGQLAAGESYPLASFGQDNVAPDFVQESERLKQSNPGRIVIYAEQTADGRAAYYRLGDSSSSFGRSNSVIVVADGEDFEMALSSSRILGLELDVVLVGDWPTP